MARSHRMTATRGVDAVPRSPSYEGRFGRMFRRLPTFRQSDAFLNDLADGMREDPAAARDNPAIPAGYTYFGQFVDHDITFDPATSAERQNDPDGFVNFRTPRFDLDSVYGRGPDDDPFLYDDDQPPRMLLGKGFDETAGSATTEDDLPRNSQHRALIGDPRNDENIIVSQLHLAFVKLHNRFVDEVQDEASLGDPRDVFKEAQRRARWHYQWVLVTDFLPRICGQDNVEAIWRTTDGEAPEIVTRFFRPKRGAFMPLEFSVAAYRFGHSQVRPTYRINSVVPELPIFSQSEEPQPLEDFHGFRALPRQWTIDWSFFFDLTGSGTAKQFSRRIDTQLAPGLFKLPQEPPALESLALRNLKKSRELSLPSGRRVATAMRVGEDQVLRAEELGFREPAPLWYYILREADLRRDGTSLGPVGGRIVAEVLLGILAADPLSFYGVQPDWQPTIPDVDGDGRITMADLLHFAVPEQTGQAPAPPDTWN